MKKHGFVVCILIIVAQASVGQTSEFGFQEGTIVKKDGTVIKVYVELAVTYGGKVAYKMTREGKELSLKSEEIKSIQTPYKYIENIILDDKERLMALVSGEQAKLFIHLTINSSGRRVDVNNFTADIKSDPIIIYAIKKGDNFTKVTKKDYKQKLAESLSDQPSLVDRIKNDEFKFDDMEKVINEYNNLFKIHAKRQITVKVIDSETKKPIKDVKVTVQGTDVMAATNIIGFTQITTEAVDTLLIEHADYEVGLIKVPEANSFVIALTRKAVKK